MWILFVPRQRSPGCRLLGFSLVLQFSVQFVNVREARAKLQNG